MSLAAALFCVDAFTSRAGAGNPAGVCLLEKPEDPAWMQLVAREMNLSETAFVVQDDDRFVLRWFTPRVEIELAGHPTLAAAHVLWEEGYLGRHDPALFTSPGGHLSARKRDNRIKLDFPLIPIEPSPPPAGLLDALQGIHPRWIGKSRYDYLVEVSDEYEVRRLVPDFRQLLKISMRGVIVTAPSSAPGVDFVSRFFAPAVGVDEDPVTGSAHCCLAPYWQQRLKKDTLVAYQASERGGSLYLQACGNGRVKIEGEAVTVWKGSLLV